MSNYSMFIDARGCTLNDYQQDALEEWKHAKKFIDALVKEGNSNMNREIPESPLKITIRRIPEQKVRTLRRCHHRT